MIEEPREVLEPEVLPPVEKEPQRRNQKPFEDWKRSFGPVMLGMLIDAVDLLTLGPAGLRGGFILGSVAAYFMCSVYRLPFSYKILTSLVAGLYCMIPGTAFLPLATVLAFLSRFRR